MYMVRDGGSDRVNRKFCARVYRLWSGSRRRDGMELVLVPEKTPFYEWIYKLRHKEVVAEEKDEGPEINYKDDDNRPAAYLLFGPGLVVVEHEHDHDGISAAEDNDESSSPSSSSSSLHADDGGKLPRDPVPFYGTLAINSCHGGPNCPLSRNRSCHKFHKVSESIGSGGGSVLSMMAHDNGRWHLFAACVFGERRREKDREMLNQSHHK